MKSAFILTGVTEFTAKIVEAGKAAIELGDSLSKAAIKAGVGGRDISELAYAAKLADVDLGSLSTALKKMQVAVSEARSGNKEMVSTFHALGIEIATLKGKKPDEIFEIVADQVSRLGTAEDRARALTALFGKAGGDLAPLFEDGAAGIQKARMEAEKLGYSFSDDTLKRLADTDDSIKRMKASAEALSVTLTSKLAPVLTKTFDAAADGAYGRLAKRFLVGGGWLGLIRQGIEENDKISNKQFEDDRHGIITRHTAAAPIGFAAQNASEEAAKAAVASQKVLDKFIDGYHDALHDMNTEVDRESDASLEKDLDRWMQRQDAANEFYDDFLQREKEAEVLRDQAALRTASFFKDTILGAFDDMVNGTKIKWSEMLKYLALQVARAGLAKAIDSAFASKASKSSGSGFWSSVGDFVGSLFSGSGSSPDGRASGGPVTAGQTYLVGERGMELFRPRTSGSIVPNHALGGGGQITIAPVYHINNPDNTARLPAILAENNRRLFDDLSRSGLLVN
jgi:hypothetical protein